MKFVATLFVLLAIGAFALPEDNQVASTILNKCEGGKSETKVTTKLIETKWSSTNIFSIEVCVSVGKEVEQCPTVNELSFLDETAADKEVAVHFDIKMVKTAQDAPLGSIAWDFSKDKEVKDFIAGTPVCKTFLPCELVKAIENVPDMTNTNVMVAGSIKNLQVKGAKAALTPGAVSITVQGTGIVASKEGPVTGQKQQPFTVLCNGFDCNPNPNVTLTAHNATLTLDADEKKAPICTILPATSRDVAASPKTVYVTYYDKCTTDKCIPADGVKFDIKKKTAPTEAPESPTTTSGAAAVSAIMATAAVVVALV